MLPKFHQHVMCTTRGLDTLDKIYSDIKLAYRAKQLPHLVQSDHMSLFLIPACSPMRKSERTAVRAITSWPDDDCFERTNWDIFEHTDLKLFTDSVLCYIKTCTEMVKVKELILIPKQKGMDDRRNQQLLRGRNAGFKSGDKNHYRLAWSNLKRGIRKVSGISTGSPQGCMLSFLLFLLQKHCCVSVHQI